MRRGANKIHILKGFGYDVIGPVKDFTDLFDSVCYTNGSTIDSDNAPKEQVIVLVPKNC
jgi:hypothetical protein